MQNRLYSGIKIRVFVSSALRAVGAELRERVRQRVAS